jgi:Tfp pilus assembly protein PilF
MMIGPSRLAICTLVVAAFLFQPAAGQRTTGRSSSSRTPATPDTNTQPIFVAGRVVMDGGGSLPEPVAIERVCNGVSRREGYTDFKGHFQLQLGINLAFQDASENDPRTTPGSPVRTSSHSANRRTTDLTSCEFRAVLAGFHSSTVSLRTSGDMFQFDIGTIVLKRMGDVQGATVSLTTMSAPKDARQAYEKALRASQNNKSDEEEKELEKAVHLYPQFAAAWSMLGDLHQRHNQTEEARTAYKQSLAADPQYVNPVFGLTLLAVQAKDWEEAARLSAQVAMMNAYAFPAALFYNAAANYNLGKYAAAEESARKYKKIDIEHKHPDVSLLLSNLLEQKNDFANAAQQIRDYLAVVPNAANAEELKARAKSLEDMSLAKKQ